ncbi:MAG: tetratricopeptide repeat protein [Calditrichaeota bacterium]|nr:tetratricopeptide repeat protein [Calditrichota bacterium]
MIPGGQWCGGLRLLVMAVLLWMNGMIAAQSGIGYYFEQGNAAYRQQDYAAAIEWYQKILEMGYESPEVYFNLGNCYFKQNDIGRAILYYEKARRLAPDDPDVAFNLELTNLKVIDRVELPPRFFLFEWWDAVKYFWTPAQWARLFMIFWIGFFLLAGVSLYLSRERLRRLVKTGLWVLGILVLLSGYFLWVNAREEARRIQAVVLQPSVTVYSAPEENSTEIFIVHEGLKVDVKEQRGDWARIVLPDGKQGWIRKEQLGII